MTKSVTYDKSVLAQMCLCGDSKMSHFGHGHRRDCKLCDCEKFVKSKHRTKKEIDEWILKNQIRRLLVK